MSISDLTFILSPLPLFIEWVHTVVGSRPTLYILFLLLYRLNNSNTYGPFDKRFKSTPFHGVVTGSNPVGVIVMA